MQALLVLALVLNVTWAVDIVCLSNIVSINPFEKICPSGTLYCYRETDTDGITTWGCGLCPGGAGSNCEQCVGNTDTPCNTESYEPGALCFVNGKDDVGVTPVDCPTNTVLCYSPSSAYTGKKGSSGGFTKFGCGICPETAGENNCVQCDQGTGGSACNKQYVAGMKSEIMCYVTTKSNANRPPGVVGGIPTTLPAKCSPASIDKCYRQIIGGSFLHYEYGCGECPDPQTGKNCETCKGHDDKLCDFMDDEYEEYSHGNVMMLNTLLLPLLLALWV